MRFGGLPGLLAISSVLSACSSGTPASSGDAPQASASAAAPEPEPPPTPAEPEPVQTGHACATGTSECGGGYCTIKIKNDCDTPLTCDAFALLRCRTPTDLVEARGRERKTFPAKAADEVVVQAKCTEGDPVQTELTELKCQ
jgi:hypothetical protein